MDSNNVGEMYMEEKNGKKKPGTKKTLCSKKGNGQYLTEIICKQYKMNLEKSVIFFQRN